MKLTFKAVLCAATILCCTAAFGGRTKRGAADKVVVAYVTSWSDVMPDPAAMTHINYAFGHVNETHDGVRIDNEERLRSIVALKKIDPSLKVLLSVGGWGSGGFSEMAADKDRRWLFARHCRYLVEAFGLDGIDIDWEYPTSSAAGISASAGDTENFTLLMRDLRKALGWDRLLTIATVCDARYIDFKAVVPYLDFVNIMAYDMGRAPKHHAALYPSANSGFMTASGAVEAHLAASVPASKLVMGLPFYGRGGERYSDFADYRTIRESDEFAERWDDEAKVPYLADRQTGEFVLGFENPRSLAVKCGYIRSEGLRGAMYWDYAGDNAGGDMRRAVYDGILGEDGAKADADSVQRRILVLTERGGQHGGFTDAAMKWLETFAADNGFALTEIHDTKKIDGEFLARHKVFVQLDYPPYNWTDTAEAALERALFDGTIGWVGFHHAALLGEFDGFGMWDWFSDYMGGIRFENYIASTASGRVAVERRNHPVMSGVDPSFDVVREEWYTFDRSPRGRVEVLAHVDESSYAPASEVKMGDHPVVWTNPRVKGRNVYFLMGHDAELMRNGNFTKMFANALTWAAGPANWFPRFRVLVHYNDRVEEAHRRFAHDGVRFFRDMTIGDGMVVDVTDDIGDFNDEKLRSYHLVISLNDNPGHSPEQREAFRRYMENGGAWLGFHAAAYNDGSTKWPWFVDFLGGGVFHRNNWPPQSAKLTIDDPSHPVTKAMPESYISPQNEWYQWKPSPRERDNVKVLVTLAPENYPLGFKDTVTDGDFPVVWSNTDYNMVYMNMGHGERIFVDPAQNYLIYNAVRWLMRERFE